MQRKPVLLQGGWQSMLWSEAGGLGHTEEITDDGVGSSPNSTSNSKIELFHGISLLLFIFPVIIPISIEIHSFFQAYRGAFK